MKQLRWIGSILIPLAGLVVAYDNGTVPRWVRAGAVAVLAVAGTQVVPAVRSVTLASAKDHLPDVAPLIEQAQHGSVDR